MKKQKSSTTALSEFSSSDDESEKATPKIDKEELRKYLKNSDDEESSQDQITPKTSPKRRKNVKRLKTPPIEGSPIIKPKKVISKDPPQNYLVLGDNLKKVQKKRKNLVLHLLIIPKEKIINTSSNTITKRFTSVLPTLKIT